MVSGKYLKDYTLQNTIGADGKVRTVSVYAGPLFRYAADSEALRRARRAFCAAAAACAGAALVPLLVNVPLVRVWYAMLPLALALLPTGELVYRAAAVLRKPRLTRRERDRAASAPAWSMALLLLAALSLAGQAVYAARGAYAAADLPVTLATLVLAAGAGRMFSLRGAFATEETAAE